MPQAGTIKQSLRQQLRCKRRDLSNVQQKRASLQLFSFLKRQPVLLRAKRIAGYLAQDGEINIASVCAWAWQRNKKYFLPTLNNSSVQKKLSFLPVTPITRFKKNRFGIAEPNLTINHACPIWQLDIILLPLVGFDKQGGRLGMGGGFYDRSLSTLHQYPRKPLLIGVAHSCQEVDAVPKEEWDILMDAIVSDEGLVFVKRSLRHQFNK